jgi:hypothetical protein
MNGQAIVTQQVFQRFPFENQVSLSVIDQDRRWTTDASVSRKGNGR